MPIGGPEPTKIYQPTCLQNLAVGVCVNKIFRHDPSILAKSYRLGILPVQLANEIYCQWAKVALDGAKATLRTPYEICAITAIAKDMAQDDLKAAQSTLFYLGGPRTRNRRQVGLTYEAYIATFEKKLDQAKSEHKDASERYFGVLNDLTHRLERVKNIFTKEDRQAIMAAIPESPLKELHNELFRQVLRAKLHFASTPRHEKGVLRTPIATNNPTCLDIPILKTPWIRSIQTRTPPRDESGTPV